MAEAVKALKTGVPGSRQLARNGISGAVALQVNAVTVGPVFTEVILQYPDGFIRTHQFENGNTSALKEKISGFLFGRYNVAPVGDYDVPALEVGATINLEVE